MSDLDINNYDFINERGYDPLKSFEEGHNPESYFWIQPANVLNYADTNEIDYVDEAEEKEISIEENAFGDFLLKYCVAVFDENLKANRCRQEWGGHPLTYYGRTRFELNLVYNYFTFDQIRQIIRLIKCDVWAYKEPIQKFYLTFIEHMEDMIAWAKEHNYSFIVIEGP